MNSKLYKGKSYRLYMEISKIELAETLNAIKNFDDIDEKILREIIKDPQIGTIALANKINMAPKNLLVRIKKLITIGVITKDKVKMKPKGWKRVFVPVRAQLFLDIKEDGDKLVKEYQQKLEAKMKEDKK